MIDWTDLAPEVFRLRGGGLSLAEIADRIGVPVKALRDWRRRNRIVLPRIQHARLMLNEPLREALWPTSKDGLREFSRHYYHANREAILARRRKKQQSAK